MLVFPLLWLPIVADFARFGSNGRSAARGSFAGVFIATVWFGVLGILYLPATDSGDVPGFVVGMQLGLGALVLLLVLQIDEVYASAYAALPATEALGVTYTTLAPVLIIVAAIPAAIVFGTADVESYALLIASVFVPAFAVVLAQAFVAGPRPWMVPVAAWALGFALYQWISPAEIGWWQDLISSPLEAAGLAFPLSDMSSLGAAIPAFLLAFVIDVAGAALARLRPVQRAGVQTTG
jgi:hypothetical protein